MHLIILKKSNLGKNYKVPFRSNLKIYKNKIVAASQNNDLYFFNKKTGETISLIQLKKPKLKISSLIIFL